MSIFKQAVWGTLGMKLTRAEQAALLQTVGGRQEHRVDKLTGQLRLLRKLIELPIRWEVESSSYGARDTAFEQLKHVETVLGLIIRTTRLAQQEMPSANTALVRRFAIFGYIQSIASPLRLPRPRFSSSHQNR